MIIYNLYEDNEGRDIGTFSTMEKAVEVIKEEAEEAKKWDAEQKCFNGKLVKSKKKLFNRIIYIYESDELCMEYHIIPIEVDTIINKIEF